MPSSAGWAVAKLSTAAVSVYCCTPHTFSAMHTPLATQDFTPAVCWH